MDANNLTCHGEPWHSKEIRYMRLARIYFFLTCRKRHSKVIRNIMYFNAPFFFLKESFIFFMFFSCREPRTCTPTPTQNPRAAAGACFFFVSLLLVKIGKYILKV